MKRLCLFSAVILFLGVCAAVNAEQTADELLEAVVLIRASVPEDARTARYLGTTRQGNGVLIDSDGLVLTIGYVILEAEHIEILRPGDESIPATFVGYDNNSGLGLLRVQEPLHISPIELGRSSEVKVGDPLLVASFAGPEAVEGTHVIVRQEFVSYWEYLLENAIFTAPPFMDFGGAALINQDGRLVGIGSLLTQVVTPDRGSVPCNMFVPVDMLPPVLADLLATGRPPEPRKPWLGIQAQESQDRLYVTRVSSGGPAVQAGIKAGDVIIEVADHRPGGLADFYRTVWDLGGAGVEVPIRVQRENQTLDLMIQSADRYDFLRIPRRGPK